MFGICCKLLVYALNYILHISQCKVEIFFWNRDNTFIYSWCHYCLTCTHKNDPLPTFYPAYLRPFSNAQPSVSPVFFHHSILIGLRPEGLCKKEIFSASVHIKWIRDWSIGKYRPQNTKEESVFLCKFLFFFTFSKTFPPLCLRLGALRGCQVATKMSNTITSTVPQMPHDGRDCVLHSGHDLLLSGPLSSWWFLLYIL